MLASITFKSGGLFGGIVSRRSRVLRVFSRLDKSSSSSSLGLKYVDVGFRGRRLDEEVVGWVESCGRAVHRCAAGVSMRACGSVADTGTLSLLCVFWRTGGRLVLEGVALCRASREALTKG